MARSTLGSSIRRTFATLTTLSLAAAAALTAVPAHAATISEREGNDTPETAQTITLGDTVNGRVSASAESQRYDNDYYKFVITKTGEFTIDVRSSTAVKNSANSSYGLSVGIATPRPDGNVDQLFWHDFVGSKLDGSAYKDQSLFLAPGTYYFMIYSEEGDSGWNGAYTFTLKHTPKVAEGERNDSVVTANTFSAGQTINGSSYSFADSQDTRDPDVMYLDVKVAGRYYLDLRFASGGPGTDGYAVEFIKPSQDAYVLDQKGNEAVYDLSNIDHNGSKIRSHTYDLTAGKYLVILSNTGERYDNFYWGKKYTFGLFEVSSKGTAKVSGTAKTDKTLTAIGSGFTPSNVAMSYQWMRNGVAIKGATSKTYKLTGADYGKNISVRITGNKSTIAAPLVAQSAAVKVAANTFSATPKPKISGTAKVGKKLTVKPGSWKPSGVTVKYQWYSNGKKIKGATGKTLKLTKKYKGKKITVKVTGSKTGYKSVTKSSSAKKIKK